MSNVGVDGERGVGHVVDDADGEVVARASRCASSSKTALTMRRGELLRGQAVAAADHARVDREGEQAGLARLAQGGDDVEVERLADRARLLGAVEHGDRAARSSGSAATKCSIENGR